MTNSSGHQAQAYSYDPYGTVTATPESGGPPNAFFFQGGYQVNGQQKSLLQFGARMYDSTTGRWTQQDPAKHLTNPTEANGFGFAEDDPVNTTDPSGEAGMAGSETKAYGDEAKWCAHHAWNYYHELAVYNKCQYAAAHANPKTDECHEWGFLIGLFGLPEDAVPIAVQRVIKMMGLGLILSC
jgi:RHS repeat-associated protein